MRLPEVSRRTFLSNVALAGTGIAAQARALPFRGSRRRSSPNEKLNIACVGCGGKGISDIRGVETENIVGLCDIDFNQAIGMFQKHPRAKRFRDYRRMLDELDKEIDAVVVSTPDHMHFPIAMMAIEMGKHAFVQKPMAHTVWEARTLAETAAAKGVATQMGNQGHANEGTRRVYEWVRSGSIGAVREVHMYTNRPIWPQNIAMPTQSEPAPETLDWDLWLGVAPERPFHPSYHPFKWRGWWDFGCGALGDMGCHIVDAAFWALDLRDPIWVEAESDASDADTTPSWSIVTYYFGPRGDMPPCKLIWYDGNKLPPLPAHLETGRRPPSGNGQFIIGEKATIMADTYCGSARIIPEAQMQAIGVPEKVLPRIKGGHYQEWIRACKGGTPAGSNFVDHSGPLTETVLLGNVAIRAGERLYWDAKEMACRGAPEAVRFIRHPYRIF